jgi:DNA-binding transcriptional MocR family regulator
MAISKYSLEPLSRGGLIFGYAGTNEEAITLGVKKLAEVLKQF